MTTMMMMMMRMMTTIATDRLSSFACPLQVDVFGLREVGAREGFSFVQLTSGIEVGGVVPCVALNRRTQ